MKKLHAKKLGYSVLRRCSFFVAPTELVKNPWGVSPCIGGNKPTVLTLGLLSQRLRFWFFSVTHLQTGINWHFFGTPWSKSMWQCGCYGQILRPRELQVWVTFWPPEVWSISHWRTSPWCSRYIKISDVCGHSHDRSEDLNDLNGSTQVLRCCLSQFVPGFWCCNS